MPIDIDLPEIGSSNWGGALNASLAALATVPDLAAASAATAVAASAAAETARADAVTAKNAAQAVGTTTSTVIDGVLADPNSTASVRLAGAFSKKFQVNVSEYATPQAALDAAPVGSRVFFPAATYTLTVPLKVKANNIHIDALGAEFVQTTWGEPGFEAVGFDGIIWDVGSVRFSGTRGGVGTSYRGGSRYTNGAGIWTNGDRHSVRYLRTTGMPVGVFLSSWVTSTSTDRYGESNHLGDVKGTGANFGLLYVGQNNLRVDDLEYSDDIDDSSGANPTHVIYCSATTSFRSTGGEVKNVRGHNILGGQAFQFKFHDKLKLGSLSAQNSKGVFNAIDCDDMVSDSVSITGSLANGGQGSFVMQTSVANSKRPKFAQISVELAAGVDERAISIIAEDGEFPGLSASVAHSAAMNVALSDVVIRGPRNRFTAPRVTSSGAGHCRAFTAGYAGLPANDTMITDPVVVGSNMGVNVVAGSTGVVVSYDLPSQKLTGTGPFISTTSGTGTEQYSNVSVAPVSLSTIGDNPALHALVTATPTVGVANMALQVKVNPKRTIAVSSLVWFSVAPSGNYDIAIIDDATNVRLWSRGSTAWSAAGAITEAVTGVTLFAGRQYRVVFGADNATGTYRGLQSSVLGMDLRMDGTTNTTGVSAAFPVPSTLVVGSSSTTTRTPLIIITGV